MTDWGYEITVDGVRPAWLTDDSPVSWRHFGSSEWTTSTATALSWTGGKYCRPVSYVRLPADSYVYRALDAGFEPWPGADNAPHDWDGGDVLWDTGWVGSVPLINLWNRKNINPEYAYVIGYRRKSEPTLRTSDEALRRMEALVRRMAAMFYAGDGPGLVVWNADYEEAANIAGILTDPVVDPDLLEARKIMADIAGPLLDHALATKEYLSGEKDNVPAMRAVVAGIQRGRELAAER